MNKKLKFINGSPLANLLKSRSAIFSLSLRKYSHPSELYQAVKLAISTIGECDFSLCDSIQRYNYVWQKNLSLNEGHTQANQEGDFWIHWFTALFKDEPIKPNILKWDYWLDQPDFPEQKNFIDQLYEKDALFKNTIEESIVRFLRRYTANPNHAAFDIEQAKKMSREIVKEETAVLILQAQKKYDFEIFVEKRNPGLQYVYENIVWQQHPFLLQPILIKITL